MGKTTAKVKNNLREVAKELIELYAKEKRYKDMPLAKTPLGKKNLKINFHIKKQTTN